MPLLTAQAAPRLQLHAGADAAPNQGARNPRDSSNSARCDCFNFQAAVIQICVWWGQMGAEGLAESPGVGRKPVCQHMPQWCVEGSPSRCCIIGWQVERADRGHSLPRLEKGLYTSVPAGLYRRNQVGRYTADVPGNLVNWLVPRALLRKGESSVKKCKEGIGGKQRIPNQRPDANPYSARRPSSPFVNLPGCKWCRKGAGMHTRRFTTMLIG